VVAQYAEYRVFDLAQASGGAGFLAVTAHGETERGLHDISYRPA